MTAARRISARRRRGSALVLVLVMTLSMAGLAVSAVLLTSSASFVQRFYDKDKDFRFFARAGIARTKSAVQRDTTLSIPYDTAYRAFTAQTLTDAGGTTIASIRFNSYAAYTGDTAGTYIPFLTLMAQAYDTLGTRSIQRLDLQSEAFSRYAIFVDTFLPSTSLGTGIHVHGRTHGNRNWASASGGSTYYDTLSLVGTSITGTSTYTGTVAVTGAKRIKWPTSTSLSNLPTLASAGNLSFAPVFSYTGSEARTGANNINVSGENVSGASARSGSRLSFKPVDVNNNGTLDATEGFFELFDLAAGMDTALLRVDPVSAATGENTRVYSQASLSFTGNSVVMNQCGLLIRKANGRREFFPVGRFRELWVRAYVKNNSVAPVFSTADTSTMGGYYVNTGDTIPSTAAVELMLSFGVGFSRCFPVGSPYLMLMERYVDGACAVDSTVLNTPYAWGATAAGCGVGVQYGGQDTTFTPNVRRCWVTGTAGLCSGTAGVSGQVRLGSWRQFGGVSTANPPAAVLQAVETPYLWPISSTYNSASRGVIYSNTTSPLWVSDTLRGFATLYGHGRIILIDDLVYDRDPTDSDAKCRNMLGLIADTSIKVASGALNYFRRGPTTSTTTVRFLGTPNFNLHAVALALSTTTSTSSSSNIRAHGVVGVEDSATAITVTTSAVISCNGTNSFGGCFNLTGGAIMKVYHQSHGAANTGLVRNFIADPCLAQATNRRPPFFPLTGKYVDYKWSEVDTRDADTWTEIKTYLARLRGNNRAVP